MSEPAEQSAVAEAPAAELDADASAATTTTTTTVDDNDTSEFDRAPAPDDEDGPEAEDGEGDASEGGKPAATETDLVEVEAADGSKHKVPATLKDDFLRQADYTTKTQALANDRRALQTERSTWETQQAESRTALPAEHAKVVLVEHQLSEAKTAIQAFAAVDWDTFRAQAAADPDSQALYDQTRAAYNAARDRLADLADQAKAAKDELTTKETDRRLERDRHNDTVLKEADAILAQDVPGWSPELVRNLAAFAQTELKVSPGELRDTLIGTDGKPDVRFIKGLAMLHSTLAENTTLKADLAKARAQRATADNHEKAQTTAPAAVVKGSGAAPRDPTTPRGDGLGTMEWMARRNAQVSGKRK